MAGRILNGLQHIAQSLALRRYVPGVATAPLTNVVFGWLLLRQLRADQPRPVPPLARTMGAGAVMVPVSTGVGASSLAAFPRVMGQRRRSRWHNVASLGNLGIPGKAFGRLATSHVLTGVVVVWRFRLARTDLNVSGPSICAAVRSSRVGNLAGRRRRLRQCVSR